MPDIALSKLPFFANVRTPARAIVFVYLFLGIGVAAAIATALKSERAIANGALLTLVAALMLLDFYPAHLHHDDGLRPRACRSGEGSRAEFWRARPALWLQRREFLHGAAGHGRPIAQGVIARQLAPTLADHLEVRDLAAQRRQLRAAKIKYILLHHAKGGMFAWDSAFEGNAARYRRTYPIVGDGPDITLLRVY